MRPIVRKTRVVKRPGGGFIVQVGLATGLSSCPHVWSTTDRWFAREDKATLFADTLSRQDLVEGDIVWESK